METICVLMSTYNGEKYLKEQIDSILNQKEVDVRLIIRDDGSKDGTKKILKEYSERFSNITFLNDINVGCKDSFYKVSEYGFKNFPECEYFAFADQDDYWMPNKLRRGIDAVKGVRNSNLPNLYFTPPTIVDQELKELDKKWRTDNLLTFEESCLIQPCAGCCMVFNRRALELYLRGKTEKMKLHDAWIYKVVLACGGQVIEDKESTILYRQHGNNVVGGNQSTKDTWKRRFNTFIHNRSGRSDSVKAILDTYEDLMPKENRISANIIVKYKTSIKAKIKLLFTNRFKTNRKTANNLFFISVLFNRF